MKYAVVFSTLLAGAFCIHYTQYNLGKALDKYDSDEPPPGRNTVRIGLYINQMQITDDGTMKVVAYVRQSWKDERLAGIAEKVRLVGERYKQIWRPDTFFRNAIKAGRRNNGLTVEQLTTINSTGHVWHVMSIEGEFGCPMPHPDFPGNLTCPIMIESYGYTTDTLEYEFLDHPVDIDPLIHIKDFTVYDLILRNCTQTYTAGSFPCQSIDFVFRRDQTCK